MPPTPPPLRSRAYARLVTGPAGHLVAGVADVAEGAARYGLWRLQRRVLGARRAPRHPGAPR